MDKYEAFNALLEMCKKLQSIPPTGICVAWDWWLLAPLLASDYIIFAAYMIVPGLMRYISKRRGDIKGNSAKMWWLFQAFILLCGFTHLNSMIGVFVADFLKIEILVKALCAIASLATGWVLFANKEHFINMKSAAQVAEMEAKIVYLEDENRKLRLLRETDGFQKRG